MKTLKTRAECYAAMMDALDAVKAVQAAGIRGDIVVEQGLSFVLAEARVALDTVCFRLELPATKEGK